MNAGNRDSCHQLFKNLKILLLKSQYILSFHYSLPKTEIHMNQIQQFTILTPYLVLPYTGCPRRNVRYFGRVFLMLNYTDITQNTYIQS